MLSDLHIPSEEEYLNCIRCGLCLSVCPTYRESLTETASPRGRVALVRMNLEGRLASSPNLNAQIDACFTCQACDATCPVGIHPSELVLHMRSRREETHPSPWKKALFDGLVARPQRLELGTLPLQLVELLGMRRLLHAARLNQLLPSPLRDLEAMLPPIPRRPLRPRLPEVSPARGERRRHVAYFLGCVQSLLYAEQSEATVRVLTRNGCAVVTPRNAVCCGMPAAGYGRMDIVREQARQNIAQFESTRAPIILTDCATCGSMLKDYGRILASDPRWAKRAEAFSSKVRDISEFLASIPLQRPFLRIPVRVTYHDPCHLRRGQGIWKQPRAILGMIDGLQLVELPEADWCCGSAGTQLITHYETSSKVLERKMRNLKSTRAEFIASGCPGCRMQLSAGVRRRGLQVKVVHPVELLDQAYGDRSL